MKIKRAAHAKINLGLDVVGILENGYHAVRMVMQSLALHDDIEIEENEDNNIVIYSDSDGIPTDKRNLCYQAAALLKETYAIETGVTVTIKKKIPVAAGLAGGSTDAAAVLTGMNELFQLGLSQDALMALGVKIGADVPYCILGKTALAEGIGEKLTVLREMPVCPVLLFTPAVSVATGPVYQKLDSLRDYAHPDIDGLIHAVEAGRLEEIAGRLGNVLELVTERENPVITAVKARMQEVGAKGVLMSGSGPTVFGIFEDTSLVENTYEKLKSENFNGQFIITATKGG